MTKPAAQCPPGARPATSHFLSGIYRKWYAPRPELTIPDWLSDMRRAHAALLGEDVRIDLMLEQSIAILEHAIVAQGAGCRRNSTTIEKKGRASRAKITKHRAPNRWRLFYRDTGRDKPSALKQK